MLPGKRQLNDTVDGVNFVAIIFILLEICVYRLIGSVLNCKLPNLQFYFPVSKYIHFPLIYLIQSTMQVTYATTLCTGISYKLTPLVLC